MAETLSRRRLNRATLARQLLLARERMPVVDAVERLGGLQAQEPRPPFLALWSRVDGFRREDLLEALHRREVVRATMMRATLHVMSARDVAVARCALQPMMTAAMQSALRGRMDELDVQATVASARRALGERPRTFGELRPLLAERFPDADDRALGYATRTHLPLVAVPGDEPWGFPADTVFAPAETWLGAPLDVDDRAGLERLIERHLGAFGPATAADIASWSGVKGVREILDGMEGRLRTFADERGRVLHDLPDAPLPDEDAPAPARLLPQFDSLLLAHADRSRIVADEHRPRLATRNLRIPAAFLVDGFVAGTWKVRRTKRAVTLTLSPFARLPRGAADELSAEADALLAFAEDPAAERRLEVSPP